MNEYRSVREKDDSLTPERQEMEFNFARVWHMLGLAHLAVRGYQRVLELGNEIRAEAEEEKKKRKKIAKLQNVDHDGDVTMAKEEEQEEEATRSSEQWQQQQQQRQEPFVEDFSCEAALALQNIYAHNGDLYAAKAITEQWLVI